MLRGRRYPLKPLAPISTTARVLLGLLFFVLFFAAWAVATFGGFVSKTFLADPLTMLAEGWLLISKHGFLGDLRRPCVESVPRQPADHGAGGL